MKYLIIGVNFKPYGRGNHHVSKRLVDHMPEHFDYAESIEISDLRDVSEKYRKIILRCQVPYAYNMKVNAVVLHGINHTFYIRAEHALSIINTCTNGFHYYKENKNIKNYIPLITDYESKGHPKSITLGFYARLWSHYDSYRAFCELIDSLKFKVNVYTMGQKVEIKSNNIKSINHTYDKDEFFSNISHYVYPTSSSFIDPFPHSLLEAVQARKQIIIPTIQRNFKDGIDDIKEVIGWTRRLEVDNYHDNSNCILNFQNFKKFYQKVVENDFNYEFNRTKYPKFINWLNGEIL